MTKSKTVLIIALIEILIGGITFLATLASLFTASNAKAPNVLAFVLLTSCISATLGLGLLKHKKRAFELLIYFSSIIILSKILILAGIITLNGALEMSVPPDLKNFISVSYHAAIIFFLTRKEIKALFIK